MISVFDAIADGLAEHSYAVADQFLSQREVRAIVGLEEFQNGLKAFSKAGIGKQQQYQINEGIRGDYIQWLDKPTAPPETMIYLDRLQTLIQYLNETLFLSLKDYEVHMTYPIDDIDAGRKADWQKLQAMAKKRQLKHPEKKVNIRPDWSHETQSLATFLAAHQSFEKKIRIVPDDEPYLINLLEEVEIAAEDDDE